LPEQVAIDVLRSAFNSAGQRCSALRVLFLQQDIAARVLDLIEGAVAELALGDPALLATDVGPVINEQAREGLEAHVARMQREARLLCRAPLAHGTEHGSFFAPCVFEIDSLKQLPYEVFGPVLHVLRYRAEELDRVVDAINQSGYGLTLGIHTRIEASARYIQQRAHVGNTYVNRNQIGAVVGVQPFGGEGLSGTGPKAGGPRYLQRFATERTLSINTAAVGGNAALLSQGDDTQT
jgi:RHH-type proline utilization regulon transcriptional repressor/proline dehydrogenase/delta 1-pyrroline-5-carboxylate dehydrogenase